MTSKDHTQERGEPQRVRWGPVDQKSAGITVESSQSQEFIDWPELKGEIEMMVLPQVRVVPAGSTVEVADLGDRKNWVVEIRTPDGKVVGHLWLGPDPDNKWKWDGLVRLGESDPDNTIGSPVWQSFQRYSDGSYRRLEAKVITK